MKITMDLTPDFPRRYVGRCLHGESVYDDDLDSVMVGGGKWLCGAHVEKLVSGLGASARHTDPAKSRVQTVRRKLRSDSLK